MNTIKIYHFIAIFLYLQDSKLPVGKSHSRGQNKKKARIIYLKKTFIGKMKSKGYTQGMNITGATATDRNYIQTAGDEMLRQHQSFDTFYQPVGDGHTHPSKKEKITLVAKSDDGPIGFISGVIVYNPADRSMPFATIQAIWVEEQERGKGIARELVKKFEAEVKTKQVQRVELLVDMRNHLGKELWDSTDYTPYQERRYKTLT